MDSRTPPLFLMAPHDMSGHNSPCRQILTIEFEYRVFHGFQSILYSNSIVKIYRHGELWPHAFLSMYQLWVSVLFPRILRHLPIFDFTPASPSPTHLFFRNSCLSLSLHRYNTTQHYTIIQITIGMVKRSSSLRAGISSKEEIYQVSYTWN